MNTAVKIRIINKIKKTHFHNFIVDESTYICSTKLAKTGDKQY